MDISVSDGTVSSVANLATEALKFFAPKETETVSQDYENTAQAQLLELDAIMAVEDSPTRAAHLGSFVDGLCLAGGRPVGQLSGRCFRDVPVEAIQSLCELAVDAGKARKILAGLLKVQATPK